MVGCFFIVCVFVINMLVLLFMGGLGLFKKDVLVFKFIILKSFSTCFF